MKPRMINHQPLHKAKGFTLIEVVVAVGIVAVALAVMVQSVTDLAMNNQRLKEQVFAQWVAHNVMERELLSMPKFQAGSQSGTEDLANNTWFWKRRIVKTTMPKFYQYEVDIYKRKDDKNAVYTLSAYYSEAVKPCAKQPKQAGDCE